MDSEPRAQSRGCGQMTVSAALALWIGLFPIGTAALIHVILPGTVSDQTLAAAAIVATAAFLVPPLVATALLTRSRSGWHAIAALAASSVAVGGYLLVDAAGWEDARHGVQIRYLHAACEGNGIHLQDRFGSRNLQKHTIYVAGRRGTYGRGSRTPTPPRRRPACTR